MNAEIFERNEYYCPERKQEREELHYWCQQMQKGNKATVAEWIKNTTIVIGGATEGGNGGWLMNELTLQSQVLDNQGGWCVGHLHERWRDVMID